MRFQAPSGSGEVNSLSIRTQSGCGAVNSSVFECFRSARTPEAPEAREAHVAETRAGAQLTCHTSSKSSCLESKCQRERRFFERKLLKPEREHFRTARTPEASEAHEAREAHDQSIEYIFFVF